MRVQGLLMLSVLLFATAQVAFAGIAACQDCMFNCTGLDAGKCKEQFSPPTETITGPPPTTPAGLDVCWNVTCASACNGTRTVAAELRCAEECNDENRPTACNTEKECISECEAGRAATLAPDNQPKIPSSTRPTGPSGPSGPPSDATSVVSCLPMALILLTLH